MPRSSRRRSRQPAALTPTTDNIARLPSLLPPSPRTNGSMPKSMPTPMSSFEAPVMSQDSDDELPSLNQIFKSSNMPVPDWAKEQEKDVKLARSPTIPSPVSATAGPSSSTKRKSAYDHSPRLAPPLRTRSTPTPPTTSTSISPVDRDETPVNEFPDSEDDAGDLWRDERFPRFGTETPDITGALADADVLIRRRNKDAGSANRTDGFIENFLNSIPLDDDAPVGTRRRRGRLVKKKDLDDETAPKDAFELTDDESESDEETDAQVIEKERQRMEDAAKRLKCKPVMVMEQRRERIEAADERGEDPLAAHVQSENDSESISDTHMVLRRPGDPVRMANRTNKKSKGKQKAEQRAQRRQAQRAEQEVVEWVAGEDVGNRQAEHRYREVTSELKQWKLRGMTSTLLDHQILGVDWMVAREKGIKDKEAPRGGFLFDEESLHPVQSLALCLTMKQMGLGKTVQAIATMIKNPPLPDAKKKVTLIVAPVALLDQWRSEIVEHTKHGSFDVFVHHGKDKIKSLAELKQKDVVICSYHAISASMPSTKRPQGEFMTPEEWEDFYLEKRWPKRGIFHRLKFYRVILDEAHVIKNRASHISQACQELDAIHTWALTGTPIQNGLWDLFPLFKFMKHPTMGALDLYKEVMSGRLEEQTQRVQLILRSCSMRRLKTDQLLGRRLITLPKKHVTMIAQEFNLEERNLYTAVEAHARNTLNRLIKAGTVKRHYNYVLIMLLRLRQMCDHPYLILDTINADFTAADLDTALSEEIDVPEPANGTESSGLHHLLTAAKSQPIGNFEECPLCTDAMDDPVMCKCRHTFCRGCITDQIVARANAGNDTTCPMCNADINADQLESVDPREYAPQGNRQDWLEKAGTFMHSSKTQALKKQVKEWRRLYPDDRIIIFSQFVKMLDIAEKVMEDMGEETVRYTGQMNIRDRESALRTWKHSPDVNILLMSVKAGGVGLNLTQGNRIISLDLWWNGSVEEQAFARAHRMGQKKEVFIQRTVIKNSVEERIFSLQKKKMMVASAALGEGSGKLGKLSMRELMGLFGNLTRGENGQLRLESDYDIEGARARAAEITAARRLEQEHGADY